MITREEYRDLVNETYPPVTILGVQYYAGDIMESVDPIHFDTMYKEYDAQQEAMSDDN
jgi:uncharacterized protein YqfB (UPF0267 family)